MFSTAAELAVLASDPVPFAELVADRKLEPEHGLVGQIYALLWDLIVTMRIRPGQRLAEKDVAEALQASKTPVREAMIRLQEAGLVEIVPKSETYVMPIRIDRYIEACFTRLQLEIGAVRQAATRYHDYRSLIQLEAILKQQQDAHAAENDEAFFKLDEALHKAFFDMAGVPGVWDMLRKSQFDVDRIRHLKRIHNIRRGAEVIEQHTEIVKAIRAGDADAAEAALVRHIGTLNAEIDELAAHPDLLEFIDNLNGPDVPAGERKRPTRKPGLEPSGATTK